MHALLMSNIAPRLIPTNLPYYLLAIISAFFFYSRDERYLSHLYYFYLFKKLLQYYSFVCYQRQKRYTVLIMLAFSGWTIASHDVAGL